MFLLYSEACKYLGACFPRNIAHKTYLISSPFFLFKKNITKNLRDDLPPPPPLPSHNDYKVAMLFRLYTTVTENYIQGFKSTGQY